MSETWSDVTARMAEVIAGHNEFFGGDSGLREVLAVEVDLADGLTWLHDPLVRLLGQVVADVVVRLADLVAAGHLSACVVLSFAGTNACAVVAPAAEEVAWKADAYGLVPVSEHSVVLPLGSDARRLLHRVAAACELEPWRQRWEKAGGEGWARRVTFDANGRPTIADWEDEA